MPGTMPDISGSLSLMFASSSDERTENADSSAKDSPDADEPGAGSQGTER